MLSVNPNTDITEHLKSQIELLWPDVANLATAQRFRFITLLKDRVPNRAGLYVLFCEEPFQALYVGKASLRNKTSCDGLRFRIMENHLGKKGDDNFVKYAQVHFQSSSRPETCEHIRKRCSVSWIEVHDERKLLFLEHLSIAAFQPSLNRG